MKDYKKIADNLNKLINNDTVTAALGKAGSVQEVQKVLSLYSVDLTVGEIDSVIDEAARIAKDDGSLDIGEVENTFSSGSISGIDIIIEPLLTLLSKPKLKA